MFLLYSKDFLIRKEPKKCKCCLSVCVFLIVPNVFIRDLKEFLKRVPKLFLGVQKVFIRTSKEFPKSPLL